MYTSAPRVTKTSIILALLAHACTAVFSTGYHHIDEHFQILEFAAYKFGSNQATDLSWEFARQTRPALQPALVYLLMQLGHAWQFDNPFVYATCLRFLSVGGSLGCAYALWRRFAVTLHDAAATRWFVWLSLWLWFFPYLRVRFTSENWGGILFWSALALAVPSPGLAHTTARQGRRACLVGLLMGGAFLCRYQVGLMIAGFLLWSVCIARTRLRHLSVLCLSILGVVGLGILIDRWFYGVWTVTAWHYFAVNLLEDKVSTYGVSPWWGYLAEIVVKGVPPLSLALVVAPLVAWYAYPKDVCTWAMVPFVLVHTLIGHKALRFLFPLAPILPWLMVRAGQVIWAHRHWAWLPGLLQQRWARTRVLPLLGAVNLLLLLIMCFKPAYSSIAFYHYVYTRAQQQDIVVTYREYHPYQMINLITRFYQAPNIRTVRIEQENDLIALLQAGDATVFLVTRRAAASAEVPLSRVQCAPVYRNVPTWLLHFNWTDWVARTKIWTVYECQRPV